MDAATAAQWKNRLTQRYSREVNDFCRGADPSRREVVAAEATSVPVSQLRRWAMHVDESMTFMQSDFLTRPWRLVCRGLRGCVSGSGLETDEGSCCAPVP
jgi:hypothetical protein